MTRLTISPEVLMAKGNTMTTQAADFAKKIDDVYNIVNQMLTKDYISPAAAKLGNEILTYKAKLIHVPELIRAYGDYCKYVAIDTDNRQDSGAASIKPFN